jgi:hypothetical protein
MAVPYVRVVHLCRVHVYLIFGYYTEHSVSQALLKSASDKYFLFCFPPRLKNIFSFSLIHHYWLLKTINIGLYSFEAAVNCEMIAFPKT